MKKRRIILFICNVRSSHNVGSIIRSSDGFGVERIHFIGYTPYPKKSKDKRLPHIANRVETKIKKTSLGAEKSVKWTHDDNIEPLLAKYKMSGFIIAALEQTKNSIDITHFSNSDPIVLIVGSEIGGLKPEVLNLTEVSLHIPMKGTKESFNVAVAAAVALYHLQYMA